MNSNKKICIVTARGGSKGIKNKNLQLVGGISLIGRAIRSALRSQCFDEVIIDSDDDAILEEGINHGAIAFKRPAHLAQDNSKSIDVIVNVLKEKGYHQGTVALLQPTSPLRRSVDVKNAMEIFNTGKFASVVSVTEAEHHPYKTFACDDTGNILPITTFKDFEAPRQALPKYFRINGAIYINDIARLLAKQRFFIEPIGISKMDSVHSIDIDHLLDLKFANLICGEADE